MSTKDLAQAIRDMATLGRLSPDSEDAISAILDPPEADDDKSSETKSTAKTGGTKS